MSCIASNSSSINDTSTNKPPISTMNDNVANANGTKRGSNREKSYQIPRKPTTHKNADAPIRFNCRFGAVGLHRNHGKLLPKSPRGNQMTLSRRLSRRILKASPGSPMWVISSWSYSLFQGALLADFNVACLTIVLVLHPSSTLAALLKQRWRRVQIMRGNAKQNNLKRISTEPKFIRLGNGRKIENELSGGTLITDFIHRFITHVRAQIPLAGQQNAIK